MIPLLIISGIVAVCAVYHLYLTGKKFKQLETDVEFLKDSINDLYSRVTKR